MSDSSLLNLRAIRAMREEDYRIARKHKAEAAARVSTPRDRLAYSGACEWERICGERMERARRAVVAISEVAAARLAEVAS